MPSPPIVFYLKYTKADDALRMLAELLDGGVSAEEAVAGSLVNGLVSSPSAMYFGSIVTSNDGTMTMMADTMTVVADPRLNRLNCSGDNQRHRSHRIVFKGHRQRQQYHRHRDLRLVSRDRIEVHPGQ